MKIQNFSAVFVSNINNKKDNEIEYKPIPSLVELPKYKET